MRRLEWFVITGVFVFSCFGLGWLTTHHPYMGLGVVWLGLYLLFA